ncbi:MAG: type VI secretion system baseplate subunit TssE [Verrucomicrobiota bacterium]
MAETTPIERLQPCLLDRLTDEEPEKPDESRAQRVISHQKYRRGVLRDLGWLFNTDAYVQPPGVDNFHLKDYVEAHRSVINYGIRQLCGQTSLDLARLQEDLAEAIRVFEPRIAARTLVVHADIERNLVTFEIEGELWANPLPDHLYVKTTVDLETGQCLLGDAPHG